MKLGLSMFYDVYVYCVYQGVRACPRRRRGQGSSEGHCEDVQKEDCQAHSRKAFLEGHNFFAIDIDIYDELPCSDLHPREHDKAAAWNPFNSMHLKILLHRIWAGLCKSVQGGPCKSVQWDSMLAMGSVET